MKISSVRIEKVGKEKVENIEIERLETYIKDKSEKIWTNSEPDILDYLADMPACQSIRANDSGPNLYMSLEFRPCETTS